MRENQRVRELRIGAPMSSPLPIPIADIPSRLGATLGAIFIGATIAAVFVQNLGFDAMLTPCSMFYGICCLTWARKNDTLSSG